MKPAYTPRSTVFTSLFFALAYLTVHPLAATNFIDINVNLALTIEGQRVFEKDLLNYQFGTKRVYQSVHHTTVTHLHCVKKGDAEDLKQLISSTVNPLLEAQPVTFDSASVDVWGPGKLSSNWNIVLRPTKDSEEKLLALNNAIKVKLDERNQGNLIAIKLRPEYFKAHITAIKLRQPDQDTYDRLYKDEVEQLKARVANKIFPLQVESKVSFLEVEQPDSRCGAMSDAPRIESPKETANRICAEEVSDDAIDGVISKVSTCIAQFESRSQEGSPKSWSRTPQRTPSPPNTPNRSPSPVTPASPSPKVTRAQESACVNEQIDESRRRAKSLEVDRSVILKKMSATGGVRLVGSAADPITHAFPGDVDGFEQITFRTRDLNEAAHEYAAQLQMAMTNIQKSENPKLHFIELKAGSDDRLNGLSEMLKKCEQIQLNGGRAELLKALRREVDSLMLSGNVAFSKIESGRINETLQAIHDAVFSTEASEKCKDLAEIIREKRILRWTLDEALAGKKTVTLRTVTLEEALKQKEVVKVDTVTLMDGLLFEASNFFYATMLDEHDALIPMNNRLSDDYAAELEKDVAHYSAAGPDYNLMKAAKRKWRVALIRVEEEKGARQEGAKQYLSDLVPLFARPASALYQLSAQLETLTLLAGKVDEREAKSISSFIKSLRDRIFSCVFDLDLKNNLIMDIDRLESISRGLPDSLANLTLLAKQIRKVLREQVNEMTKLYLQDNNVDLGQAL